MCHPSIHLETAFTELGDVKTHMNKLGNKLPVREKERKKERDVYT